MRRLHYRLFSINLCLLVVSVLLGSKLHANSPTNKLNRILVICSYDVTFPTYTQQMAGLRSELEGSNYQIDVEFMDSKKFPIDCVRDSFEASLSNKLDHTNAYDLVITADDNALNFVIEKRDSLFPEVPLIFLGVNNLKRGLEMNQHLGVTGVLEQPSLQENVDLMHRTFPKAKTIHAVVDNRLTSKTDWQTLQNECAIPDGIQLNALDLSQMSFEELYNEVAHFNRDEELLLLLGAFVDSTGTYLTLEETIDKLVKHCPVPIFYPYEFGIGDGILGGKVVSHFAQGQTAGQIAKRVLHGENINQIPVVATSPNRHIFDYSIARKFNASKSRFPQDTQWINPHISTFEKYKIQIVGTILLLLFLSGVATVFFALWRKQVLISQKLSESELINSRFFNNPFAIMLVINPDNGQIVNANETAVRFYGYSRAELLKLHVYDLNTLSRHESKQHIKHALKRDKNTFHFQHRLKNGELRDVEVSSGPIVMEQQEYLFSIIRDQTGSIAARKALLAAKEAAERADEAKSNFLAVVSHEMITPLNPIMGNTSLLLEDISNKEQRRQLIEIMTSSEKLRKMTHEILKFSKLSSDSYELSHQNFVFDQLIEELQRLHSVNTQGNRFKLKPLTTNGSTPIPKHLKLHGPKDILEHIISNLLGNAFKFTKDGTVTLQYGLLEETGQQAHLIVEVLDTGVGMSKEAQQIIFEPFQQIDNSYSRNYEGVGLGLSICQKLSTLIDAELSVQSRLGEGTRFTLTVWIDKSTHENTPSPHNHTNQNNFPSV